MTLIVGLLTVVQKWRVGSVFFLAICKIVEADM
jgi:hypothetical protein